MLQVQLNLECGTMIKLLCNVIVNLSLWLLYGHLKYVMALITSDKNLEYSLNNCLPERGRVKMMMAGQMPLM